MVLEITGQETSPEFPWSVAIAHDLGAAVVCSRAGWRSCSKRKGKRESRQPHLPWGHLLHRRSSCCTLGNAQPSGGGTKPRVKGR